MKNVRPLANDWSGVASFIETLPYTMIKSFLSAALLSLIIAGAASAEPVNKNCPVTGKPVNPNCKTSYEGKEVAFCSGKCCKEFKADPKKYADKIK